MNLTETANQQAFDLNQEQQKKSAQWLKAQAKSVNKPVLLTALAGIGNGIGVIAQAALLALLLHLVVIEHAQLEQREADFFGAEGLPSQYSSPNL